MHRNIKLATMVVFVFIISATSMAFAEEGVWAPPAPSASDRDWIRLSSGEWLWGTIELMRDESLEFDSEELDDVSMDWDDVVEIRSSRVMTYVLLDGTLFTGTAALKKGILRVEAADGMHELSKISIHSILEGEPSELNFWSAKVGADWKIFSGNTTQSDFGSRIFLKREAIRSRVDLRYQGFVSTVSEVETINNHRINAEYKIFLSRKFFLTPIKAEFYSDKFKNIDLRISASVGAGYFISRSSKADWYVEAGVGMEMNQYSSVLPGEDDTDSYANIPLRTTLEMDLTDTIELTAEYGLQIGLADNASNVQHAFLMFDFDLIGELGFIASLTWDYISDPKMNAEGITPEKSDLIMAYGLSIDF